MKFFILLIFLIFFNSCNSVKEINNVKVIGKMSDVIEKSIFN